jgi:hypothetical protein
VRIKHGNGDEQCIFALGVAAEKNNYAWWALVRSSISSEEAIR